MRTFRGIYALTDRMFSIVYKSRALLFFMFLALSIAVSSTAIGNEKNIQQLNQHLSKLAQDDAVFQRELATIGTIAAGIDRVRLPQALPVARELGKEFAKAIADLQKTNSYNELEEARSKFRMAIALAVKAQTWADRWTRYWKEESPLAGEVIRDAYYVAVAIGAEVSYKDAGITGIVAITMVTIAATIIPYKFTLRKAEHYKVNAVMQAFWEGAAEAQLFIHPELRRGWLKEVLHFPTSVVDCRTALRGVMTRETRSEK